MRRFAPLPVKHAPSTDNIAAGLPVVDWSAIGKVDYLALWQSVDWKAGHPLQSDAEALAEWRKLIEGERAQDSVEIWLRQFGQEARRQTAWQGKDLYPCYKFFCEDNGYKAVAANTLGRRMKAFEKLPWFPLERGRTVAHCTKWTPKSASLVPFKPKDGGLAALRAKLEEAKANKPRGGIMSRMPMMREPDPDDDFWNAPSWGSRSNDDGEVS